MTDLTAHAELVKRLRARCELSYSELRYYGPSDRVTDDNAAGAITHLSAEVERLRQSMNSDPNTLMIAYEDGAHERLAEAVSRLTRERNRARAEVARLREQCNSLSQSGLNNAADFMRVERQRDEALKALELALCILGKLEPGDSRAVSDEFVAMAAVSVGIGGAKCMEVINATLSRLTEGSDKP